VFSIATNKEVVGVWIAHHINMIWKPEGTETVGLMRNGALVAGVMYEDWNTQSITAHIAIKGLINRQFLHVIFDYPFNQLKVNKIVAPVLSSNLKSINLVKKMGFTEHARLKDIHPSGDMIFFVIDKTACKYLGARYG
jgi:RimJ/RimL family protein N-acetyltransferase